MSTRTLGASCAAAALACAVTLSAQTPAAQPGASTDKAQTAITIAGCVQKETDVLKRSAVAGGAGMGDEFVLTNAKLGGGAAAESPKTDAAAAPPAAAPPAAAPGAPGATPPPAATGTSGAARGFEKVYRVTGDKENELKNYIGRRVEIVGAFKRAEDAAAELAAKGRVTPGDLTTENTPEITIQSIKPAAGSCSGGAGL